MANVEEDSLIEETLKEWDEFHSGILSISGRAKAFIAKKTEKGGKQSSSEYSENITGVQLPSLQLPKFSGNVLEWSAFTMHLSHLLTRITGLATCRSLPI